MYENKRVESVSRVRRRFEIYYYYSLVARRRLLRRVRRAAAVFTSLADRFRR